MGRTVMDDRPSIEAASAVTSSLLAQAAFPAPLCSPTCAPVFEAVDLPIWKELVWPATWLALRFSPVYFGRVQSRGRGGPVVLVPGFLASDLHLLDLQLWLRRIGYQPVASDIGRNADCPDVLLERLMETIDEAYGRTGRRVQLVGHSFGGVLARAAAVRRPEHVAQVITLAAPFRALRAHRTVLTTARWLSSVLPPPNLSPRTHRDHAHAEECACTFLREPQPPWPSGVRRLAVYTKDDGVVDWRSCIEDESSLNAEVRGSHAGLVFNPDVYRVLVDALAAGEEVVPAYG
jgi:pimeloyl-ACP methyl ester carboxylesterase